MADDKKLKVYVENITNIPEFFLITSERFEAVAKNFPAARERIDVEIGFDGDGLEEGLKSADILVGWQFPTEDISKRAPNLRWIQTIGAGVDHLLPLDWLPSNIILNNASGAHRPAVDEFMMASVLMLNNRFVEMMTNQKKKRWQYTHSHIIKGKTALLVGVGAAGGAAAESFKKLEMKTIGVRQSGKSHPFIDEMHGTDDLHDVLPRADFVVITVPKTSTNLGLLGRRELEMLKPGACIISLGRLGIIDDDALIDLLEKGHIAGAVFDLEDPDEVPFDERLWTAPNLLIVPHCGTNDPDLYTMNSVRIFFENLERYIAGKELENIIDRQLEY
jgi:phosphoglycerate dehydrogenase-like enzyme